MRAFALSLANTDTLIGVERGMGKRFNMWNCRQWLVEPLSKTVYLMAMLLYCTTVTTEEERRICDSLAGLQEAFDE